MSNKWRSRYKKGTKLTIEIAEVHTHYDDNGQPYSVYRIKGFNSLFLDDYAISKLVEASKLGKEDKQSHGDEGLFK